MFFPAMTAKGEEHPTAWTDRQVLQLVREHERLVRSYLRSMGCPLERAEDLAQETFLRLLSHPIPDRRPAGLRAYLCVVARNLYLNALRADASRPDLGELDRAWSGYERDDGGSAYVEALRGCLEHLPSRTRDVLRLHFGSNTSRDEIAERMRLSLGGVKSLLSRSKDTLRDCIQRKLGLDRVDSLEAAQ